jgi:hypothetical protein
MKYNKTKKKGKSKKTYVGGTEERVVVDVKKSFEIFIDDVVRSLFSNVMNSNVMNSGYDKSMMINKVIEILEILKKKKDTSKQQIRERMRKVTDQIKPKTPKELADILNKKGGSKKKRKQTKKRKN